MSRALLLGIALAACSDRTADPAVAPAPGPASTPARPTGPITVRAPGGAVTLELSPAAGTCTAKIGDEAFTVTRVGDAATIAGAPLAIERTPAGDQILRDGARVARVWRDPAKPGHVDVVAPDGMALARLDAAGGAATLADAAGNITAHVGFEGGRFVATDPHGAVIAYVQGGDAETAALVSSSLPPDVRALAACDRLNGPVSP